MTAEQLRPAFDTLHYYSLEEGWLRLTPMFQGQGGQEVGMGRDFYNRYPAVKSLYDETAEVLGYYPFDLTEDQLKQTRFAQPAIFIFNEASRIAYEKQREIDGLPPISPLYYTGNSLGQFNALLAAGAFSFEDGLRLVKARAEGMQVACDRNPSGLAAVLFPNQIPDDFLDVQRRGYRRLIDRRNGFFLEAINSKTQMIIGVYKEMLGDTEEIMHHNFNRWLQSKGVDTKGIKVIRLNVAGAFHSELMKEAEPYVDAALKTITINDLRIPVIANTTAKPISRAWEIKREIRRHTTKPVFWLQTTDFLEEQGVAGALEIGRKPILAGMMRNRGTVVGLVGGATLVGVAAFLLLRRRPPEEKKN